MKKFVALLLAMLLVLANVAALAEGGLGDKVADIEQNAAKAATAPEYSITKKYTTTGTATNVYPTETIEFTVTPKETTYPTVTIGNDGTAADTPANTFYVDGTVSEYAIPVNVPAVDQYPGLGKYHYEVKESTTQTDPSQGETYSTTTFNVDVYVSYKTEKVDGVDTVVKPLELIRTAVIYTGNETGTPTQKSDKFENQYKVGSLKVTKKIDGNLANPDLPFEIVVTLSSTDTVNNDITVTSHATSCDTTKIEKGWKTTTTPKTITFTAKGDEYIEITNIPKGVSYTVIETAGDEKTRHLADNQPATQMASANVANAYFVTGEVKDTDNKTISATTQDEVEIKNVKEITVPTGIALDTVPYILILAVALFSLIKLAARKREEY